MYTYGVCVRVCVFTYVWMDMSEHMCENVD